MHQNSLLSAPKLTLSAPKLTFKFLRLTRTFDLFSWEIAETFFQKDKSVFDKMNNAMEQNEKITIDQIKLKTIEEILLRRAHRRD
ncbi:hypothetical protein, partial [Streptomyces sp. NPDC013489]|uniref:hypothetical protein n=1 Tax=Streptomyces sp. NPDC013489 TaxID=3155606 RepID=UPI00340B414D